LIVRARRQEHLSNVSSNDRWRQLKSANTIGDGRLKRLPPGTSDAPELHSLSGIDAPPEALGVPDKAIEIAHALLRQGVSENSAIRIATAQAKRWVLAATMPHLVGARLD
jgi:hypothetical protein